MRMLAAADLHGKDGAYDWLTSVARNRRVDVIVLAGDLLGCLDGFATPEDAQGYEAALLVTRLASIGPPVFYIMGNDDLVELDSQATCVTSIHGRRAECGAFNVVGYQYSLPFMGGTFERDEEGIERDLHDLAGWMDARTIFVTHSPAFGILDPGFGDVRIGSRAIATFLDSHPYLAHVHGHSHAGFGRQDRHFNVASAGKLRAMVIDLNTLEHEFPGLVPSLR